MYLEHVASQHSRLMYTSQIKLCPSGAHTCARPLFYCCDIHINHLTLKLEGDLNILKMYFYVENEVARLRHSKLLTVDDICMVNEIQPIPAITVGKIPTKLHQFLISSFRDSVPTDRPTRPKTIPARNIAGALLNMFNVHSYAV